MRAAFLFAAAALAIAGPCAAGSLRVSPVGIELPALAPASLLTLHNDDAAPMKVQVRVFRWSQEGGVDRLEPTADIVASPPVADVPAHGQQAVRIVRLGPAPSGEESYRIIVDQLPPPPGETGREVKFLMRHSLPVFSGVAAGRERLTWRIAADDAGLVLQGANDGERRVRISNLKLTTEDGAVVAERSGLVGYLLRRSGARWRLQPAAAAPAVLPTRLSADTDLGPIDVALSPAS